MQGNGRRLLTSENSKSVNKQNNAQENNEMLSSIKSVGKYSELIILILC